MSSTRFVCVGVLTLVFGALLAYGRLFSGMVAVAQSKNPAKTTMTLDLAGFVKVYLIILMGLFGLSACAQVMQERKDHPSVKTYKAGIGIVNHTDRYIYATTVNGAYGGHGHKMNAGIANFCCVTLPEKWHPGITVKVDWDMPEGTTHIYKSKIVDVEKYDEPGELYLHFFPGDKVRVAVTMWVGASPNHPISPPPGTKMFGSE